MFTSIIIPTVFNDAAVQRCINAIKEHTKLPYELIVMDNGSEARGCVHALNQGLRAADGDVLVCMNDDCIPQPGWLTPLHLAIAFGAWLCCPQWKYARIAGHCMVFTREAYEFTGGFNEMYRHWNADHHFEVELAQAGKPICQCPNSIVLHDPNDPLRIHYRRSMYQEESGLPNTGEWYNIDNAKFHEHWQGVVPSDFWPDGWAEGAVG